jgi:succinyl-CoA synthetase beta subunit
METLSLLADYGIATPRMTVAQGLDAALAGAREIGFPVALKTANGIAHKSDADGVRLGIADEADLRAAYEDMSRRLGRRVTVSRMAPKGIELAFGIVRDPQFGPFVMVAAGGIWIEVLNDRAVALAPVSLEDASAMISELRVSRLLDGGRGVPPADRAALAAAFSRFCLLAADLGDLIEEMDVNPLLVGPQGCVAVDALLVPRHASPCTQPMEKSR